MMPVPVELIERFLQPLGAVDIMRARLVCRMWQQIIDKSTLLRLIVEQDIIGFLPPPLSSSSSSHHLFSRDPRSDILTNRRLLMRWTQRAWDSLTRPTSSDEYFLAPEKFYLPPWGSSDSVDTPGPHDQDGWDEGMGIPDHPGTFSVSVQDGCFFVVSKPLLPASVNGGVNGEEGERAYVRRIHAGPVKPMGNMGMCAESEVMLDSILMLDGPTAGYLEVKVDGERGVLLGLFRDFIAVCPLYSSSNAVLDPKSCMTYAFSNPPVYLGVASDQEENPADPEIQMWQVPDPKGLTHLGKHLAFTVTREEEVLVYAFDWTTGSQVVNVNIPRASKDHQAPFCSASVLPGEILCVLSAQRHKAEFSDGGSLLGLISLYSLADGPTQGSLLAQFALPNVHQQHGTYVQFIDVSLLTSEIPSTAHANETDSLVVVKIDAERAWPSPNPARDAREGIRPTNHRGFFVVHLSSLLSLVPPHLRLPGQVLEYEWDAWRPATAYIPAAQFDGARAFGERLMIWTLPSGIAKHPVRILEFDFRQLKARYVPAALRTKRVAQQGDKARRQFVAKARIMSPSQAALHRPSPSSLCLPKLIEDRVWPRLPDHYLGDAGTITTAMFKALQDERDYPFDGERGELGLLKREWGVKMPDEAREWRVQDLMFDQQRMLILMHRTNEQGHIIDYAFEYTNLDFCL